MYKKKSPVTGIVLITVLAATIFLGIPSASALSIIANGNTNYSFRHGQEAIDRLGLRLPAVKKKHKKSANELNKLLLQDVFVFEPVY